MPRTDATAEAAMRCWPTPGPTVLRVVSEPLAGLSHARIRGIREARHEIVSFIDDDNWVSAGLGGAGQCPFRGPSGNRARSEGESRRCARQPRRIGFICSRNIMRSGRQYEQSGDVTDTPGTLLWGAGLSLRTAAVRKLLDDGFVFMLSDRKGNLVSSGGDTELCFCAAGLRLAILV